MDTAGARYLAARLRAGAPVGSAIAVELDAPAEGLAAGDRGVIVEITPSGVVVDWERGGQSVLDPATVPYRTLSAA